MSAPATNIIAFPLQMRMVAYGLAKRGFRVFPLRPGHKLPLKRGWKTAATSDPLRVLEEWPGEQFAPGIATGADFTIIDVEAAGIATDPAALNLPPTLTFKSGSDGEHYVYRTPPGLRFANSVKKIAPHTDVRGEGGLIVGPGGYVVDPKTGEIRLYDVKHKRPIVDLPTDLAELMRAAPERTADAGQVLGDLDTPAALERARAYLADDRPPPFGPGRGVLPGGRGSAAYRVACRVGDFGISAATAYELMLPWNQTACVPPQDDDEFAKCIEHAFQYRRSAVGLDNPVRCFEEVMPAPPPVPAAGPTPTWRSRITTAAALECRVYPEPKWVLPGLLPEGLTLLVGRPKLGKSWLALDLAIAIATGGSCLGIQVSEGDVLSLALEDNERRLQRRLRKLQMQNWPTRLSLATEWNRADKDGIADMVAWANGVPRPALVIVDTLAMMKPLTRTKGYDEDYQALSGLQRFAGQHGISVLVLHHDRKLGADDPIDRVSGTLGLAGAADTVASITRSNKGTTLYLRGRDVEEAEKAISFDAATCRWQLLGNAAEVQRSEQRKTILAALKTIKSAGPTVLASMTEIPLASIKHLVRRMAESGEVIRQYGGEYSLPGVDP